MMVSTNDLGIGHLVTMDHEVFTVVGLLSLPDGGVAVELEGPRNPERVEIAAQDLDEPLWERTARTFR